MHILICLGHGCCELTVHCEHVRYALYGWAMDTTWEFMLSQTMERHHIGLMDAVIILECIRPGPWMRQEPSARPQKPQRPQRLQRPRRLSATGDSQPSAPSALSAPGAGNMCSMDTACALSRRKFQRLFDVSFVQVSYAVARKGMSNSLQVSITRYESPNKGYNHIYPNYTPTYNYP